MSDEPAPTPEAPSNPPAEGAPRARRISNPRPKKQAKPGPATEDSSAAPAAEVSPKPAKFPEFSAAPDSMDDSQPPRGDWPEPEAPSSGASSAPENPKRKRRRKKGKGNGGQHASAPAEGDSPPQGGEDAAASAQSPRPQNQAPRPKLDPETLSKCAWKIYLAEISEEGVALVGDNDARELSRRCFRLAEIFLEEQARRR